MSSLAIGKRKFGDHGGSPTCGHHATGACVTGLTRRVRAGYFRCDIKGLRAESTKLNEEFSPAFSPMGERDRRCWRNNPTTTPTAQDPLSLSRPETQADDASQSFR